MTEVIILNRKIFAIFIIFAVLITCAGVSFASSDFDDTFIEDSDIDDYDLSDDLDDELSDDSDDEFDDIDDDDLDDEDWDDDYDDEDLDDEDWDYEAIDWENWEYYYDDLDFIDDYNETDGNGSLIKKAYLYKNASKYIMYTTSKTSGAAFGAGSDYNQKDCDNATGYEDEKIVYYVTLPAPFIDSAIEEVKGVNESPTASVSKSIDLGNIKEDLSIGESDTNKTNKSLNIIDINVASEEFDGGILAILALIIICMIAII